MTTENLLQPYPPPPEKDNNMTMWILICDIVILCGVIITIIVMSCWKKKWMKHETSQNELAPSDPPAYTERPISYTNGVCSDEESNETLEKGKISNAV